MIICVVVMEFFIGTSGWMYGWNEKQSVDWYVANSGLNAVELNASFYPFRIQTTLSLGRLKEKS